MHILQPRFSHTSNSLRGELANHVQNYGFSIASFSISEKKKQPSQNLSTSLYVFFSRDLMLTSIFLFIDMMLTDLFVLQGHCTLFKNYKSLFFFKYKESQLIFENLLCPLYPENRVLGAPIPNLLPSCPNDRIKNTNILLSSP